MIKFVNPRNNHNITTKEAVENSSLDIKELFANLIEHLNTKHGLTANEIAEIFYWDYEVTED